MEGELRAVQGCKVIHGGSCPPDQPEGAVLVEQLENIGVGGGFHGEVFLELFVPGKGGL